MLSSLYKDLSETEKNVVFILSSGNDFTEEEKSKMIEYLKKEI